MERYEALKKLRGAGWTISAISRKLGMHRETVRTFLRAETFPERAPAYGALGRLNLQGLLAAALGRRLFQRSAALP